jgi:hypothetical protein
MSVLAIVLIIVGVTVLFALFLGYLGTRARDRRQADTWLAHVAEADSALEQARAADKGWDRDAMEQAAASAIAAEKPGWSYDELLLVLVDDRPGTEEDRAHFVAIDHGGQEGRVVLSRQGDRWSPEQFDWLGE